MTDTRNLLTRADVPYPQEFEWDEIDGVEYAVGPATGGEATSDSGGDEEPISDAKESVSAEDSDEEESGEETAEDEAPAETADEEVTAEGDTDASVEPEEAVHEQEQQSRPVDLSGLNKSELIALAEQRGVEIDKTARKAEIQAALEA